jgi:hypothetical protein
VDKRAKTAMRLDELFDVSYGNKFDLNKMTRTHSGIAFIGRRGFNQGVSGIVERLKEVDPYPPGLLTVALGGSKVLATFVQQNPFYTAQNVVVLRPLDPSMALRDRLYYTLCIKANRYRYTAFGREANRTLRTIDVPGVVPLLGDMTTPVKTMLQAMPNVSVPQDTHDGRSGRVKEFFEVRYGHSLELNRLQLQSGPDSINFVSRTDRNNGVSARVRTPSGLRPGCPGELTVALGGTPLATFLQPQPFVCGRDVAILSAIEPMSDSEKLWRAMCIRANRYRFSYGRQANRTLGELILPPMPTAERIHEAVQCAVGLVRETLLSNLDVVQ